MPAAPALPPTNVVMATAPVPTSRLPNNVAPAG
jgi:hypothetical protein